MTADELAAHITERIATHERICQLAGHEVKETDQCMTLLGGRTAPKLGVRPVRLGSTFRDGEPWWFYGFTVKQCKKILSDIEEGRWR